MKNSHARQVIATHRAAFTLIEIIVVIVIIGVLLAIIAPKYIYQVGKANTTVARQNLAALEQAIETFRLDYGKYPQSLNDLVQRPSYVEADKWNQPAIKAKQINDPWGTVYVYRFPGDNSVFDLYSLGADGLEGGTDENTDVTSW